MPPLAAPGSPTEDFTTMLEDEPTTQPFSTNPPLGSDAEGMASDRQTTRRRRSPATKATAPASETPDVRDGSPATTADDAQATPRKRAAKKVAAAPAKRAKAAPASAGEADNELAGGEPAARAIKAKAAPAKRASKTAKAGGARKADADTSAAPAATSDVATGSTVAVTASEPAVAASGRPVAIPTVLFQAPQADPAPTAAVEPAPTRPRRERARAVPTEDAQGAERADETATRETSAESAEGAGDGAEHDGPRRRRRGGRGRRSGHADGRDLDAADSAEGGSGDADLAGQAGEADSDDGDEHDGEGSASSRRRRRRRKRGSGADADDRAPDDPPNTVVRVREPRDHDDRGGVQGVKGSTRLEAKKQRRREGREQIRRGRRGLVITEAEFLARRESVDRVMVVRQRGERTQIGVIEDGVLVEHFVSTASTNRMVGNVFLGRVQNVLPGMEAAFIDIGKGRNAVLYAGEVNFDMSGLDGQPRRIESALKPGQAVLVQVTKDSIGHKGARLTSQVSLPGRYLVYVPEGSMMGISRKLPDVERSRLKSILRKVMPEGAGVIVRTAAEGASEEELSRDVARLSAQWEVIQKKAETANAPALLYGEPDLTIRVIRDVFNEDFNSLVVQADSEWDTVEAYVAHVAPDLVPRLSRWTSEEDVFTHYRVDEQIAKALDRKVWLPSGGYLVIDRTEAMIVIDVNTGRFIGKGGNLEETVTKNNLEAAEEIVRQLRLRDIGGIIVIDFIDMVLESNRDLVLRRLVECLGRDRTKHQVAEVTSLGLVQMTRKRVGNGLLEAFSEICEHCNGRGVIVHTDPVEQRPSRQSGPPSTPKPGPGGAAKSSRGGRGKRAATPADVGGAVVSSDAVADGAVDSAATPSSDADTAASDANGSAANEPGGSGAGGSRTRRGGRRRGGSKSGAAVATDGSGAGESAEHGASAHESAPQPV